MFPFSHIYFFGILNPQSWSFRHHKPPHLLYYSAILFFLLNLLEKLIDGFLPLSRFAPYKKNKKRIDWSSRALVYGWNIIFFLYIYLYKYT